jgi:MFS family permease
VAVPVFIAEIAPTSIRGGLGAVNQFGVTIGIFTVYVVGDIFQKQQNTIFPCVGTQYNNCSYIVAAWTCNAETAVPVCEGKLTEWRLISFIGAGIACVLLVCVILLLPETPAFLVKNGKEAEARRVLAGVRDSPEEVERDLAALSASAMALVAETQQSIDPMDNENTSQLTGFVADAERPQAKQVGVPGLFVPGVRAPFGIGCMLMFFQQLSGINAVIFYSADIVSLSGMKDPNLGGLIIMGVQVAMTGVAVLLMDRAGRRTLLLISLGTMIVALALLAAFYLNHKQPPWLALISLILYICGFSLGLGAIPWLIMSELFPTHVRATAASVATLLNWSLSFLVTLTFSSVADALTPAGVFILFGGICVAGFGFVFSFVPETRGKTFEEIEAIFK